MRRAEASRGLRSSRTILAFVDTAVTSKRFAKASGCRGNPASSNASMSFTGAPSADPRATRSARFNRGVNTVNSSPLRSAIDCGGFPSSHRNEFGAANHTFPVETRG